MIQVSSAVPTDPHIQDGCVQQIKSEQILREEVPCERFAIIPSVSINVYLWIV